MCLVSLWSFRNKAYQQTNLWHLSYSAVCGLSDFCLLEDVNLSTGSECEQRKYDQWHTLEVHDTKLR